MFPSSEMLFLVDLIDLLILNDKYKVLRSTFSDPPCKNGITMLDYAEQNVCGEILKYLLDVSIDDTCS